MSASFNPHQHVPTSAAAVSGASDASYTRATAIAFGILGTVLALSSLAVAILGVTVAVKQYFLQKRTGANVKRGDDDIEMSPQRSAHKLCTPTPPPL
jgi:mannose/fructose/N-acetylgalactosamine-specific phosphotransferase system component IIC